MSIFRSLIALLILGLFLSACSSLVTREPAPIEAFRSATINDANAALQLGDLSSGLTLLRMAASEASEPVATGLRLEAALLALQLDDPSAGERLIKQRLASASASNEAVRTLVQIALNQPASARTTIEQLQSLPAPLTERMEPYRLNLMADALARTGAIERAITTRLTLSEQNTSTALQIANEAALWQLLIRTDIQKLHDLRERKSAGLAQDWLALAIGVLDTALEPTATQQWLSDWRQQNPAHPASRLLETRILATQRSDLAPPARVAVLLPLSGNLAPASQAIRQGILAAHYARPGQRRAQLQFIDVGPEGSAPTLAYRQAVDAGASQVIGPLSKAAVREVLSQRRLPIPVIALNRVDGLNQIANAFQFGLAPEDDARASAALAKALGYQRIALLSSADDWGQRVSSAFTEGFTAQQNSIVESGRYPADADDLSEPIKALFNLDDSEARYARLRSITGQRFGFEARRREDMDAVFIAAFEPAARLITPQIRFHRGIGLPVLGTSQSYPQVPSTVANDDLNGLLFTRMPWLLNEQPTSLTQRASEQLSDAGQTDAGTSQLVALGIDSYQLLSAINALSRNPSLRLQGASGVLQLAEAGRIQRHLVPVQVQSSGLRRLAQPVMP